MAVKIPSHRETDLCIQFVAVPPSPTKTHLCCFKVAKARVLADIAAKKLGVDGFQKTDHTSSIANLVDVFCQPVWAFSVWLFGAHPALLLLYRFKRSVTHNMLRKSEGGREREREKKKKKQPSLHLTYLETKRLHTTSTPSRPPT